MNPTEFRRHLHAHPELSFKEHDTAAFIADRLTELGIEHRPIARTGVLAWIEGRGKADPKRRAVVLRADIDALPITEQNDIGWRSCTPGVMHACGHDMHRGGTLRGIAAARRRTRLPRHALRAVPAGRGSATRAVRRWCWPKTRSTGTRCVPWWASTSSRNWRSGTLGFRAGKYMASSDELRFSVHGTGGHGAMRPQLKDPVAAAAEVRDAAHRAQPRGVRALDRTHRGRRCHEHRPRRGLPGGTLRTFDERERGNHPPAHSQHRRRDRQAPGGADRRRHQPRFTPAWSTTNTS